MAKIMNAGVTTHLMFPEKKAWQKKGLFQKLLPAQDLRFHLDAFHKL